MFMNGLSFDDDAPARSGSRARKSRDDDVSDAVEVLSLDDQRTGSGAHPNALLDDDLDAVGGAEYLSGARSNVIQQQRELQKKKLQERMGGAGAEVVMTTAMTAVALAAAEADSLAVDKGRAAATNARKPKLDITDMRAFILRPIPKAYDVVECYIERNKSGSNKMFPEYCLYMKEGDRFLLTAKKRPKNRTSNYLVSLQRGDLLRRGSDNYVGKLRANFLGTEFTIYDSGSSPKDADQQTITSNPAGIRQELGIAMYAANVLGHRGPRKMKVCVPRVRDDGTRVVWRPLNKDDEMVNKCKEQDHTNLTYLINKPPRWNDQVCAYVLNFNGRVTMASVKNFQLVTPEDQETVVLQFGRVGKDLFTMDFRWPLCPLQAFAITLSSFDSKLACE
ncbi:hypothetical protein BBO99_00000802 [Phytophthora kernoviae]|uniref:Tubby C-terminal domain-containing protein n=2 Tax=Phytophthora kernoviae TaxID=325452 RepID=A0A3F2RQ83_9STRA|nr:hypothetical protein G195_005809 [Phytophthora kernoviae 00238/432]KAG2524329.1 hypothetical protein JM16_005036 [Phytophthora kernoviae]KAG2526055.1 hypothetical protein JM18_004585 [Phytophthora kernoviae]RLN46784.1 hypothetical protein BBI17_000633 [Phytophthora kernoviae]RLN56831.1 hypothetical protein BBJ29_003180 [Phytophthora kernoviae]